MIAGFLDYVFSGPLVVSTPTSDRLLRSVCSLFRLLTTSISTTEYQSFWILFQVFMPETGDQMIIDHPGRLHMGITNG